jgi:hypothetical protein
MIARFCITLLLLVASFSIQAADPPEITWLRDTPASLFDVGMLKLNLHLQKLRFSDKTEMNPRASYDYDRNSIRVDVSLFEIKPSRGVDAAKAKCEEGIKTLRQILGIVSSKPDPRQSIISIMFEPTRDFGSKGARISMPEEVAQFLVKNVELSIRISHKAGITECNGRLDSEKIFFVQ